MKKIVIDTGLTFIFKFLLIQLYLEFKQQLKLFNSILSILPTFLSMTIHQNKLIKLRNEKDFFRFVLVFIMKEVAELKWNFITIIVFI